MSTLIQVSDPHFGTERTEVLAALRRLCGRTCPDLLVVSGDITQRARRRQFRRAREGLSSLGIPRMLAIPGNHDVPLLNLPARLMWPYRGYRRAFGDDLEPSLVLPDLVVIAVDGTRRWRHVNGELSRAQRQRVAAQLQAAAPGALRVVVTHQPLCVPGPAERANLLRGHHRALQQWIEAGADLFLGGHIHLPYLHRVRGPGGRGAWCLQAGTALSTRTRPPEPNSVNLLHTGRHGLGSSTAERWDFDEISGEFGLRSSWKLAPNRPPEGT